MAGISDHMESFLISKKPGYWKLAGKDIVSESKYCPEIVIRYAAKPQQSLASEFRKHLSYLGWKIEFSRAGGVLRFRYTSPDDANRSYLSLQKVCSDLMYHTDGVQQSGNIVDIIPELQEPEETEMVDVQEVSKGTGNGSKLKQTSDKNVFVEPEYCPQSVVDWYFYDSKNKDRNSGVKPAEMTLKAKKHLSCMGWVFWYGIKKNKRELRYTSPTGTSYYSLKTACKGCIDEGGGDGDHVAAKGNLSISPFDVGTMKLSAVLQTRKRSICPMKVESEIEFEGKEKPRSLRDENNSPAKRRRKELQTLYRLKERKEGTKSTSCNLRSSKRVRQGVAPVSSNVHPRSVLSSLIDNNVVLPREKVNYRGREDRTGILGGRITRDGIKCNCCQKVFALGGFQVHAAGVTDSKPAASIFMDDGRSLLDCQMQLMKILEANSNQTMTNGIRKQGENDDVCSVCHYGGELILCDSCPSSFHESCLGLKNVPDGDWFCASCCCGICGQRRIGDIQDPVNEEFLSCHQCEHKYHIGCLRNVGRLQNYHLEANWFCSGGCEGVFVGLQMLLGKPVSVGADNLSWKILQYSDDLDVEELMERYSKLKVAVEVMHECFEPVKDARTGRDLVEDVVFSRRSQLNHSNYRGFYTILLERNEEIISVANVRIHGKRVAELPLVGTRFHYHRRGMCRILMNELEKQLKILGVEKLILPAVPSVLHIWTDSFGFSRVTESERLQYLDSIFLDFQETVMCQKLLLETCSIASWPRLVYRNEDDHDHLSSSPQSEVLDEEEIEKSRFVDSVLLECPTMVAFC